MHNTLPLLEPSGFPSIRRRKLETLQVNIGLRCNLACLHCHTNSNSYRKEAMDENTIELVPDCLRKHKIKILDITGGAPELHPRFRELVQGAREYGVHVIDRCNLTVLEEPDQSDLDEFLAENEVEIIASLPCYTRENVDAQRGNGVFDGSIRVLKRLNHLGYGRDKSGLILNLVYNPLGPSLPPPQSVLEQEYKIQLYEHFGIVFNQLFVLCNMPIKRFGSILVSRGQFHDYMELLKDSYHHENLESVMCRTLISIDWQGFVYDCDFNQMLGLNLHNKNNGKLHIRDLLEQDIEGSAIKVCDHCYGCVAGQGSSCGGALS